MRFLDRFFKSHVPNDSECYGQLLYLTKQELELWYHIECDDPKAHSFRFVRDKYLENPYMPTNVCDGKISAEDCDYERRIIIRSFPTSGKYWVVPKYINPQATLEPLDLDKKSKTYGCTLSDPVLIWPFKKTDPEMGSEFDYIGCKRYEMWYDERDNKFPYQRGTVKAVKRIPW
jgi:hypothetical protein